MQSQSYRILLVEDDSSWTETLFSMLEDGDGTFQVVQVRSLQEGLARLCAEPVDALLVDERMLGKRISVLAKIHARFQSLPIVVLNSQEEEEQGKLFLDAGASECLVRETLGSALLKKVLLYSVDRKRTGRALRESEERFRELFENAKDIIFTLDLEGNVTSLNKSAEEVLGWTREEAREINIKDIVTPEHLSLSGQMMRRIVNEEPQQHFEIGILRKDSKKVLLEVSARLIQSKGMKKGVQGIARDVTERRDLENRIRQSQKLDAIGRLSGGLAHDFNNLLCIITGHAELLSDRLAPEHPGTKNATQIRKAVDSASSLVRQLLAFSGKQVFHPQTLDLNEIVVETEKLLGCLVGEHIEFGISLNPAPGVVRVDPVQIEQVIVNLIFNARDAMPEGGNLTLATNNVDLVEDCQSKRLTIPAGKYATLAVTDNGCGMDEETQNRIFEPFYTTKELGKGTGLGLATVYGIVKQSGGNIAVFSKPGQGTTFRIYFPRIEMPSVDELSVNPESDCRAATETILLVENEEPLREIAKQFLRSSGYEVLEAGNGKAALRIARAFGGPIHLLLTDVHMPGMGGKQLAKEFASLRPAAKVLYMSGYSDDGIVYSGRAGDKSIFLEKPFTRAILSQRVRQVLDGVPQFARTVGQ
jgi:two-component system cell cycle sensor histidine kinase/response regulator CckA